VLVLFGVFTKLYSIITADAETANCIMQANGNTINKPGNYVIEITLPLLFNFAGVGRPERANRLILNLATR
jgi:hypothetical protein